MKDHDGRKGRESREADSLRLTLAPEHRNGAKIKVVGVGGLADHISSPVFATPVGVALYTHRNRVPEPRGPGGAFSRVVSQLRSIFKEFF